MDEIIVPTNVPYTSSLLRQNINNLMNTFSFLNVQIVGLSVLGKPIHVIKLGIGNNKVFYSASIHANEWITSVLLMKFVEDYCKSYVSNANLYNHSVRDLFNSSSIYIMPMVNPDGVDLIFTDILTKKYNCWHLLEVNSLIRKLYNHRHKIKYFDCNLLC